MTIGVDAGWLRRNAFAGIFVWDKLLLLGIVLSNAISFLRSCVS